MMKNTLYIPFLLLSAGLCAQTALYNTGNLRIHDGGEIGFHTDLINNGSFDENQGLAGFYGEISRAISGSLPPTFYDMEVMTLVGTSLNIPVNVINNANFVSGNIFTPDGPSNISLHFLDSAFPSGENNNSKVVGYASVSGQQDFTFPVGDNEQLRPLILNSEGPNNLARAAYFFEDPNNPSQFAPYNTNTRANGIDDISTTEFWRLEGNVPSSVQLTWNSRSDIGSLSGEVEEIVVVGWSKATNQWEMLGGPAR